MDVSLIQEISVVFAIIDNGFPKKNITGVNT